MQEFPPILVLRDLPGIADIEAVLTTPGAWLSPANDDLPARINAVSVSLFSITEADTLKPERRIEDFLNAEHKAYAKRGLPILGSEVGYAIDALDRWIADSEEWERNFAVLYDEDDPRDFWALLGIDVEDEQGEQLECLHDFSRQLIVVARGLIPGAQLSPDGSGVRIRQDTQSWGASLEAQAAEFMKNRRK